MTNVRRHTLLSRMALSINNDKFSHGRLLSLIDYPVREKSLSTCSDIQKPSKRELLFMLISVYVTGGTSVTFNEVDDRFSFNIQMGIGGLPFR